MSSWVLLGTILIILNTGKRQEDTFNILPACEHVILNPASLKWARSAALVFLRELWWSSSLCKWMLGLFGLSWSRFTEWRGVSTSCSHKLSLQAEQPLVAPPAGRTHADLQRQISDQSVIDDLLLLSLVQQRFCGGLLFSFISCWSSEREPLYIENWRYLHSTLIRMYCILTCMYTSTVLLFMYYPFLWCALPFWQDTISSKKHLIFMHVCYLKSFGVFFVSIWAADYFFFSYFPTEIWLSLCSPSTQTCLSSTRCLSGARLYDLSWRLGQRCSSADVRQADGQIQSGGLLCALGLHLGYHGHPGRSHSLLSGFCSGEPTGRAHVRGAAGREQGWALGITGKDELLWIFFVKFITVYTKNRFHFNNRDLWFSVGNKIERVYNGTAIWMDGWMNGWISLHCAARLQFG